MSTASPPLRVLMVDDSPADVDLILRHLLRAGYRVEHQRVDRANDFGAALRESRWDVILCDYSIPGFGAHHALARLNAAILPIPFILVSGGIPSEQVVELMRDGARDYIPKSNLDRLPGAIHRELAENRRSLVGSGALPLQASGRGPRRPHRRRP